MRHSLVLASLGVVALLGGCAVAPVPAPQVRVLNHSPSAAAEVAQEHVDLLVVEQDVEAAYELMDEDAKSRVTPSDLRESVAQSPGFGVVTSVKATEYQPVPGQAAVDILLEGTAPDTTYYYSLRLSGTMEDGYLVNHFVVAEEPFPASGLRQPLP